jgi:hypothetical protein
VIGGLVGVGWSVVLVAMLQCYRCSCGTGLGGQFRGTLRRQGGMCPVIRRLRIWHVLKRSGPGLRLLGRCIQQELFSIWERANTHPKVPSAGAEPSVAETRRPLLSHWCLIQKIASSWIIVKSERRRSRVIDP